MPQHPASEHRNTPFTELQAVDSTNKYARSLIDKGLAGHGQAVFAYEQTAGKGQRGKTWESEKGQNIILSLVLNPDPLTVLQQFQLNALISVSITEFFSKYAGEQTKIKWPNDLYWQNRKAGGILIESVIGSSVHSPEYGLPPEVQKLSGKWKWAIVGIGININQTHFSDNLVNAVSLKQITGKTFDVITLAKQLTQLILENFDLLIKKGGDDFFIKYNDYLYKKGQVVKLKQDNRVFETKIKSVSKEGKLVTEKGLEEAFDFGSIEWLI